MHRIAKLEGNLDATRLCRLTEKAPVTTSVAMRRPPRTDRIL